MQHYADGEYNFGEILKNENKSKDLEDMLTGYALNVLLYVFASFGHALFLLVMGAVSSNILFARIRTLINTSVDIPINDAIRMMLFSVLVGSLNFIGGQIIGAKQELVFSMIGFNTRHDNSSQTITKQTTSTSGATTIDS